MGKTCTAILGLGLAGAIVGMHAYMCMTPDDQCELKDEFREAMDDLKKITGKLTEIG